MPLLFNRYRERNSGYQGNGIAYSLGPPLGDYTQGEYWRFRERMSDFVGHPQGANDLYFTKQGISVGAVSGQVSAYYRCSNWTVYDYWYDWDFPDVLGNSPTDNNSLLKLLAETNPSTPSVDVPVLISEFKDLPRMIKHVGDRIEFLVTYGGHRKSIAHVGSEDFLAMQFGWLPLIRDLQQMLDVMGDVFQRTIELNSLRSGMGLSRQRLVYKDTIPLGTRGFYIGPAYSNNTSIEVDYVCQHRKWASTSWRPTDKLLFANHEQNLALARRLVWGHNISYSTVWNAMPWTWMIDWFKNVGDYYAATRNNVPVEATESCVMEELAILPEDFRWTSNPHGASFVLSKKPMNSLRMRTAISGVPYPDAHLPFFTGKQLSILASLAILRFGK